MPNTHWHVPMDSATQLVNRSLTIEQRDWLVMKLCESSLHGSRVDRARAIELASYIAGRTIETDANGGFTSYGYKD